MWKYSETKTSTYVIREGTNFHSLFMSGITRMELVELLSSVISSWKNDSLATASFTVNKPLRDCVTMKHSASMFIIVQNGKVVFSGTIYDASEMLDSLSVEN